MRRIHRHELSSATRRFLQQRTEKVRLAVDPTAEARRLWGQKSNKPFDEIRLTLRAMASGRERCMYCEDSAGTDIEHFWPKSEYPLRAFDWPNYLLACSHCNSNEKRDRFLLDGNAEPLLIDPTREDPRHHLVFSPTTGKYSRKPGSAKGEPSIEVFGLHRTILVIGRRDAWVGLEALLAAYASSFEKGDTEYARRLEAAVRNASFRGILSFMLEIAEGPEAEELIRPSCLQALRDHPEIHSWV